MGELKLKKTLTISEAAEAFNKSPSLIRKYIKKSLIPVVKFAGVPVKPYEMLESDLEALFTIEPLGSLKIERLGKSGLKPPTKEEFQWPK